jgi:hypothetical protein
MARGNVHLREELNDLLHVKTGHQGHRTYFHVCGARSSLQYGELFKSS